MELAPGPLPKVKGSDDADHAGWIPLSDLKEDEFYEDHLHIIQHFLGQV
jgi:bifunctional NMN adenylyltransferase/nudix hydrolase